MATVAMPTVLTVDSSGGAPVNVSEKLHRQITVTIWKTCCCCCFFFKQKYSQHSDADIITVIKLWSLDCWHFLGLGSKFCVEEGGGVITPASTQTQERDGPEPLLSPAPVTPPLSGPGCVMSPPLVLEGIASV